MPQRRVETMDVAESSEDGTLGKSGDDIADNQKDDGTDGREGVGNDQRAELREAGLDGQKGVLRVDRHGENPVGR